MTGGASLSILGWPWPVPMRSRWVFADFYPARVPARPAGAATRTLNLLCVISCACLSRNCSGPDAFVWCCRPERGRRHSGPTIAICSRPRQTTTRPGSTAGKSFHRPCPRACELPRSMGLWALPISRERQLSRRQLSSRPTSWCSLGRRTLPKRKTLLSGPRGVRRVGFRSPLPAALFRAGSLWVPLVLSSLLSNL